MINANQIQVMNNEVLMKGTVSEINNTRIVVRVEGDYSHPLFFDPITGKNINYPDDIWIVGFQAADKYGI